MWNSPAAHEDMPYTTGIRGDRVALFIGDVTTITMPPAEARAMAAKLIEQADRLDPPSTREAS